MQSLPFNLVFLSDQKQPTLPFHKRFHAKLFYHLRYKHIFNLHLCCYFQHAPMSPNRKKISETLQHSTSRQ